MMPALSDSTRLGTTSDLQTIHFRLSKPTFPVSRDPLGMPRSSRGPMRVLGNCSRR